MLTRKIDQVLALVLAFAMPVSVVSAETNGAMLFATNSALINGSAVTKSAAIFPGDKLSVPAGSAATIQLKGTSILVPASSNVTFAGNAVLLDRQTAVSVNTTLGLAAQIQNIKISPAVKGNAYYEVARYNGRVFIAAKHGSVLIDGVGGNRIVAEGSTTSIPDPDPQATPGARGGIAVGEIPTWVAVLIGLGVTGAAAGIALGAMGKPATVSVP